MCSIGGLVGLPVAAGDLRSVAVREFGVGEPVQGGDFAGRMPRDTGADACGLEYGNAVPGALEGQRRGQAGDSSANHRHVNVQVHRKRGIAGGTGRRDPQGNLPAFEAVIHGTTFR